MLYCSDISLSAYLASLATSHKVVKNVLSAGSQYHLTVSSGLAVDTSLASSLFNSQTVLSSSNEHDFGNRFDLALGVWTQSGLSIPSDVSKQSQWDYIKCSADIDTLLPLLDQHRLACLKSASQLHSGDWLNSVFFVGYSPRQRFSANWIGYSPRTPSL